MEYYVTMCDLGSVPSIFGEIAEHNEGGQRRLNKTRLPAIEDYILNNRLGYVLPPIIASIDGTTRFLPLGDNPEHYNIGLLEIHKPFRFFINDGQHRIEAIKRAVRRHPELAIESIACVFFLDIGLQRRQQLFSDLNRHAVRATRSLSIFYDYRDPMADVARQTARQVPLFNSSLTVLGRFRCHAAQGTPVQQGFPAGGPSFVPNSVVPRSFVKNLNRRVVRSIMVVPCSSAG